MTVYALLPDVGRESLSSVVPSAITIRFLASPAAADAALRQAHVGSVCILDPVPMTSSQLDRVVAAVNVVGLPLLLCVDGRGPFASRVLALMRTSATEVLIRRVPEERFVLGRFLSQRTFVTAPALLLARLSESLLCLGRELLTPAVSLLAWAPIPSSVDNFVSGAQHRRTTERQFARAGFSGVAPLMNGARLARAWVLAKDDRATLGMVATRTGYESPRSLTEHCRRNVGSPFRRAQVNFTTELFVEQIAQRLRGVSREQVPPTVESTRTAFSACWPD